MWAIHLFKSQRRSRHPLLSFRILHQRVKPELTGDVDINYLWRVTPEHAFHLLDDVLTVPTVGTKPPISASMILQAPKLACRHCGE